MPRLLLLALAFLPLPGCTADAGDTMRQPRPHASLPSTCGRDYVTAAAGEATVPLAGCDATVGNEPLQSVKVEVGDVVELAGMDGTKLVVSSAQPTVASVEGLRVRALQAGTATVVLERGALCAPPMPPQEGPQPKRCPLLTVVVQG